MKKTIYIGGTFDLFHVGHINLLKNSKKHADYSIVAINSDEFAESYKRKPVLSEIERLEAVRACKYVDLAFIVESWDSQRKYISMLKPNYILHGNDWQGESLISQLNMTEELMDEIGIKLIYEPYTVGISSRDIIKRIKHD